MKKNEKVIIPSDNLSKNKSSNRNDNQLIIGFVTDCNKHYNYKSINGYVVIEIEMTTKFEEIEITEPDIGKSIIFGNQKIKILELADNVFHYEILDTLAPEFEIYFDKYKQISTINLPESIYRSFRENPGMNYNDFARKFSDLKNDKSSFKSFFTYVAGNCKFNKVFLYRANEKDKVKKVIKIPVKIDLNYYQTLK